MDCRQPPATILINAPVVPVPQSAQGGRPRGLGRLLAVAVRQGVPVPLSRARHARGSSHTSDQIRRTVAALDEELARIDPARARGGGQRSVPVSVA